MICFRTSLALFSDKPQYSSLLNSTLKNFYYLPINKNVCLFCENAENK